MAEYSLPEQRTELPTDRRISKLREDGNLHVSTDLVQLLSMTTGFMVLGLLWSSFYADLRTVSVQAYRAIAVTEPLTINDLHRGFISLVMLIGPHIAILVGAVATAACFATMLQTKWNRRSKWIKFRWNLLDPIGGIKRIFSVNGAMNTLKALVKLSLILPIGYMGLKGYAPEMVQLTHRGLGQVAAFTWDACFSLLWKILYVLIPLGVFDFVWGRHQWFKNVKMTKDEVKDEQKSVEGDEATRRKIVAKGLQRVMQRIMQSVPKADVIVTNPTHYSVALQYDRSSMGAPRVVAKGKGFLALRIREIAKEHNIPILERKMLARGLYASCEVGSEIPRDLFKAVAEVLAYVYRLKNRYRPASSQSAR